MTMPMKTVPGVDAEGFVARDALCHTATESSDEEFLAAFRTPALVMNMTEDTSPSARSVASEKERSQKRTIVVDLAAEAQRPVPRSRYHQRIAFLTKRAGNPFPHMISLGRSMNNDVVLLVDTVSKFQGYFITKNGLWSFTDQHSANGTLLNGKLLEKGTRYDLADGDRLRLGTAVEAQFVMPATLLKQLRGA